MLDYLIFVYILGFFLSIPFMLICIGEEIPLRDALFLIILYPIWVAPIILYLLAVLIYCVIFNKTAEEGFKDVDDKVGNWKIMSFIGRVLY